MIKGELDILSQNSQIFTTNEQKLCTTDRELMGIVFSLTIYENNNIGSEPFIIVLIDPKLVLSFFTKNGNLSSKFYTAQMQLIKFQKLRYIYTKGKNSFCS